MDDHVASHYEYKQGKAAENTCSRGPFEDTVTPQSYLAVNLPRRKDLLG